MYSNRAKETAAQEQRSGLSRPAGGTARKAACRQCPKYMILLQSYQLLCHLRVPSPPLIQSMFFFLCLCLGSSFSLLYHYCELSLVYSANNFFSCTRCIQSLLYIYIYIFIYIYIYITHIPNIYKLYLCMVVYTYDRPDGVTCNIF
jgi:hypothetical protein